MRRLIAADFAIEGLHEKSKRPHHSPNITSEEIIRKAEEIRNIEGSGCHTIARILRREHRIKITGSTVCAIFKRRGISIQEFQRLTDDFLQWYNKRRPHWSLDGLTPHERFYGRRLARSA